MADIVDSAKRSRMMSGIRGKNTKPEIAVRKHLHRLGLRFRLHDARLPGRPDLVLPRYKAIVHVHGCYWHQHSGCKFAYMPKSNQQFWKTKLDGNVRRDRETAQRLQSLGWRVFVVWECETGDPQVLNSLAASIRKPRSKEG
jgi:DNA mismatch endonuclease (patch repair protein)